MHRFCSVEKTRNVFYFADFDATGTSVTAKSLPVYAVITALEHCERHLRSLRHEDIDSAVCFFYIL